MRITFAGMDAPVEVRERGATILRVLNQRLYARVCESLVSQKGEGAVEPYSVWDDDGCEVGPANALLVVANPFDLPWKHRSMVGGLYSSLEAGLLEDEDMRRELQGFRVALESSVHKLGFQLNADYGFAVEWSLGSYLKAFSYEVDLTGASTLLDKLICFADFVADVMVGKVLVFVNLGTFLTENDLLRLNDRLFFHGISALLLENRGFGLDAGNVREYVVERDFVEYILTGRSECPSSSQGGFRSNGFGAVAF